MVNEYTKSNTGKLLAAIVAMLMVVCAVAVVAMPAEAADETVDIDSLAEYDLEQMDETGRRIIECFHDRGSVEDYCGIIPLGLK